LKAEDMTPEVETLIQIVNSVGLWAVFFYLYLDERRSHQKTREDLTLREHAARDAHMSDLREIAGMRADLGRVTRITQEFKQVTPDKQQG
jgi:hypothetical protein